PRQQGPVDGPDAGQYRLSRRAQMQRIRPVLLATIVILALMGVRPTPPAGALSATSSVDSRLRLEWEVGSRHGGRPVIQGYVHNDYVRSAAEGELPVDTANGSGG